ncbi:MAG: alcohol dehydrogenase catalytic domain-containing protein [Anaerolineales bacterium]|nr:alcohol dehydrogenase catalytic domain-containing protein [Anaerolineales bacterium]
MKGASAGNPGQVQIVDFPDMPLKPGDVRISTLACGVCTTDVKMVQKGSKEIKYALGHEISGKIIEVTPDGIWQVGQRVIVAPYLPCGGCYYCRHDQPALCSHLYDVTIYPGGLAEQVIIPRPLAQRGMFPIPDDVPDTLASISEPVGCVIKGLEDSRFKYGDSVLVVGDGPMGMFAMAVARAFGAYPILVAGMTPHRLEFARQSYADAIIDIAHENVKTVVNQHTAGIGADVVLVAVSSAEALESGISAVRAGGTVNAFAGVADGTTIPLDVRGIHYQQYYLTGSSGLAPSHLKKALTLLGSRRVDFSLLITAEFPFEAVEDAVAYATNRIGLKVVVTFK